MPSSSESPLAFWGDQASLFKVDLGVEKADVGTVAGTALGPSAPFTGDQDAFFAALAEPKGEFQGVLSFFATGMGCLEVLKACGTVPGPLGWKVAVCLAGPLFAMSLFLGKPDMPVDGQDDLLESVDLPSCTF